MADDVVALLIAFGITFYGFGTIVLAGMVRKEWKRAGRNDERGFKRRAARFALATPFWPIWGTVWGIVWLVQKAILIVRTAELLPPKHNR